MTHDRFGHSNLHTNGKFTNCLRSIGVPQSDVTLNTDPHIKNNHYLQNYTEISEPVVFMSVATNTSGRINEELLSLLFLHVNRDARALSAGRVVLGVGSIPFHSNLFD